MAKKIVIVGGAAGGATAAARLRRLDEKAQIILFERGPFISFAGCGLPYYLGRVIQNRQDLLLQTPESFQKRYAVEVRVRQEIIQIHRGEKKAEVLDHQTGRRYSESYDYLILSPGAEPFRPPIAGVQSGRIFTLRTIPDADAIDAFIEQQKPSRAVIVGGGSIGLEMAENLHHRGLKTAIVEMAPSLLPTALDPEMAWYVQSHLEEKGTAVWIHDAASRFEENEKGLQIQLKSGAVLHCDFAVLSVGVKPEVKLAKEAGLTLGRLGGIEVSDSLQTSDPAIYAIGDAVEVKHLVLGGAALIPLAGPANKQGRMAADNICGFKRIYAGSIGTAILKVFDLTAAMTGATEAALKKANFDCEKIYLHPSSHAGYYPGASVLHMKVLFSRPEGRILGAQIVGAEGVDKRIDLLSAAVQKGLTVYDLMELELAYAPPYSSAKDPIHIVGFIGFNVLNGTMPLAHFEDLREGDFVLDVRTDSEWRRGHVDGAVHIPLDQLRQRLAELPKDRVIYPYCGVGVRSYAAVRILLQNGFQVRNLSGGFMTWRARTSMAAKDSPANMTLKKSFLSR